MSAFSLASTISCQAVLIMTSVHSMCRTYFTGENTLGYEWKDVQYQVPSVTYEPGQLRLLPTRAMCDPLV